VLVKILLGVAAVIVLVVGGLALIVAMQPSEFRIERSTTIAAPAPAVFTQVNDFHNWQAWSPWAKLDPAAKNSFGEGRMTITESRPSELVRIKLEFVKPFAATNTAEFTFKPEGDRTAVTWSMFGHNNFISRAVFLFVNMDKALGSEFEKGLASMKSAAEASAKS
jgi:Polyketide cyclase / dehydrase and lipid transport